MANHFTQATASRAMGALGTLGALTCVVTLALAAFGVIGAVATGASAGMSGMSAMGGATSAQPGGLDGFLIRDGPTILVVSIVAVALAFSLRRPTALFLALLGGGLLYWGMYAQDDIGLMYATNGAALVIWAATYLWLRRPRVHAPNSSRAPR